MKTRRDDPVSVFRERYVARQRAVNNDVPLDDDDARLHHENDDVEPGALGMAQDDVDVDEDIDDDEDVDDEDSRVELSCSACDESTVVEPPQGYRFDEGITGIELEDPDDESPRARWKCSHCGAKNIARVRDAARPQTASESFRTSYARGGLRRPRGHDAAEAFRESYYAAVDDDGGTRTRLMKALWNL